MQKDDEELTELLSFDGQYSISKDIYEAVVARFDRVLEAADKRCALRKEFRKKWEQEHQEKEAFVDAYLNEED